MLIVFCVTLAAFLLVIAGMAVGVMVGRREISGSCGGLASRQDAEGGVSCSLCSNPDAACRELQRRGETDSAIKKSGGLEDENLRGEDCPQDCVSVGCDKEAIDACRGR